MFFSYDSLNIEKSVRSWYKQDNLFKLPFVKEETCEGKAAGELFRKVSGFKVTVCHSAL